MRIFLFMLFIVAISLSNTVQAQDDNASSIVIENAYAYATAPTASNGAVFMVIKNQGPDLDRLTAAASDVAGMVEIHEMYIDSDTNRMQMRELENGLSIPVKEGIALTPEGYHIMLMQLGAPLEEGTTFPLTLSFEKSGSIITQVQVTAPGQKAESHDHAEHDHHPVHAEENKEGFTHH